MKSSRLVPVIIIIAVAAFIMYSLQDGSDAEDYTATIEKERSDKEAFLKKGDGFSFYKR
jgi:hypothetical protein